MSPKKKATTKKSKHGKQKKLPGKPYVKNASYFLTTPLSEIREATDQISGCEVLGPGKFRHGVTPGHNDN
ncbi:MAG: hypothetical protein ABH956_02055 [Candidatus Nealsonbacteria bacterium]